jgi:hypothetical protein
LGGRQLPQQTEKKGPESKNKTKQTKPKEKKKEK